MDVSNASGYMTTVAADACSVAKHVTGRVKVVALRDLEPAGSAGRENLRARVRARGGRGAASRRSDRPRRACAAARDAACVIFQQPNFFGCLEPAPDLAAAASDAGSLPVAHVDPASLGVLEAPGAYGCATLAIGEGQVERRELPVSRRSPLRVHRGPSRVHPPYGEEIVGETTDLRGERGYVLTLQTREQHTRREKAIRTSRRTRRCWRSPASYLSWLGPQGLRELGRPA